MDERIGRIADYYGFDNQLEILIEECSEVIKAAQKLKRYGDEDGLMEEVADVHIMIQQMMYLLDKSNIDAIIEYKINRQIERMRDGASEV